MIEVVQQGWKRTGLRGALAQLGALALLAAGAASPAAAQQLVLEKSTNGLDADSPPGPILTVGQAVTWTYVVTNNTGFDLVIDVTDDQGVAVTCPDTALANGGSMTCTATGTVQPGQYANLGTATGSGIDIEPFLASDPSHYFGKAATDIGLRKLTNGVDANAAPGPILIIGDPVTWTYVVTNIGSRDLTNIAVSDDQGVSVSCPATTLTPGASMTCTAGGTVGAGQYANVGTATATVEDAQVSDSDPSHYFGQEEAVIALAKSTNGADADAPPGPVVPVGSAISWTYVVTNNDTEEIFDVAVSDDQGVVVSCPATTVAAGASMTCTASGSAQVGQYANIGAVIAARSNESVAAASDPSHYFGQNLVLRKATNGFNANVPPGPKLAVGAPVSWTYTVSNPGPEAVSAVAVTDDRGVVVTCPATTIAAGASMTCTAGGTAQPGQYANVGTATAQLPGGGTLTATDPSHYFGQPIRLEKSTNGVDGDVPPGPAVLVGDPVNWTYVVTNIGTVPMTNIAVSDDQGVAVSCPATSLAAGSSMTCTASGTAQAGPYSNVGTATAVVGGVDVVDLDPSHYFGVPEVLDFGDAPDPTYPTRFASNGARHVLGPSVYLGACADGELDGQPNAPASGDDAGAGIATFGTCATPGDDEDGVAFTATLVPGATVGVDVVASAACTLSAWIDFNRDGDWADAGEELFPGGSALAAGLNPLTFPVPAAAVPGGTYARFRCTTDVPSEGGAIGFTGEASDGEVEDYRVTITGLDPPTVVLVDTVPTTGDGQLSDGEVTTVGFDTILVTYSEPVADPPGDAGADDVTNPANYLLVDLDGNGTLDTSSCLAGPAGDDTTVPVTAVTYDGPTQTATLVLGAPLAPGSYALFVCGTTSILDGAGNPLNGGVDFVLGFQVVSIVAIPALSSLGGALLALLLLALGARALRRDRHRAREC